MNDTADAPQTLRDMALNSVPTALREPLLTLAAQHHISAPDDPFWPVVAAVANAMAAAQATGEAATQVRTAVQGIPAAVADGAAKAGTDIKAIIEASIAGTVKSSLDTAVQAGAATLRQAAADLPKIGRENQDRIVGEWKLALADAARKHTWAGYFQQLSVSVVLAAVLVGALFVGGVATGAWGIGRILIAAHRITPHGWVLDVGQNGQPLCGPLAGRQVCLARYVPTPAP
jgi:hypothetical protein